MGQREMSRRQRKGYRFTSILLESWRNFSQVSVALQGRAFLVGANALGKSNFLDAFRFLHDLVTVEEGLREAVRRRGGVSGLRCLSARRYSDIAIRVSIGTEEDPSIWEYKLRFNQDKQRRPVIKKERVVRDGSVILERPDKRDRRDTARMARTYLEQGHANQEFRELADFFSSVRYLHVVPQIVRESDRAAGRQRDPFGGNFFERLASTPQRTRTARLQRIVNAMRVAVPQLKELELWRDARGVPHLRGRYAHWRSGQAWQTEEQFSDGTLRLLGLLWAILDGTGPLLMEEPELSLHPEVARFIPQMFAQVQHRFQRQMLISTHSSELLRDEGIGLDEVLLLSPEARGTSIALASDSRQIEELLDGGSTLADAVIPRTRPQDVEQLMLFPD
jgi:predicted ATPase